jgi:hypothetical protein
LLAPRPDLIHGVDAIDFCGTEIDEVTAVTSPIAADDQDALAGQVEKSRGSFGVNLIVVQWNVHLTNPTVPPPIGGLEKAQIG